jgi:hypothetical protein
MEPLEDEPSTDEKPAKELWPFKESFVAQPTGKMILKLQMPIYSSEEEPKIYAYNRDKSFQGYMSITEDLRNLFNSRMKIYVDAEINEHGVFIDGVTEDRSW